MTLADDARHMERALAEAAAAATRDEVPVGAVIVSATGDVVAADGNRIRELKDPTAHAELLVIRAACAAAASERIVGATLYVTLEPCPMCATAASFARIGRIVYAASDPKGGGIEAGPRIFEQPTCHHRPLIDKGLEAGRAGQLLRDFFATKRGQTRPSPSPLKR